MKKILAGVLLLFTVVAIAGTRQQISESYGDFIGGEKTVYTVTSGKNLQLKSVIFSAFNQDSTSASIQLKDSGTIIHTFYISELQTSGTTGVYSIPIDFDEPWIVSDNILLNLNTGNSASVGASITVLGFEE